MGSDRPVVAAVAGNLAGAAVAELSPNADRWRNWALHGAVGVVGVVFAVVTVEIMPRALDELNGWQIAAAFHAGGALLTAGVLATDRRWTNEEEVLRGTFGGDYDRYATTVHRWFGRTTHDTKEPTDG